MFVLCSLFACRGQMLGFIHAESKSVRLHTPLEKGTGKDDLRMGSYDAGQGGGRHESDAVHGCGLSANEGLR